MAQLDWPTATAQLRKALDAGLQIESADNSLERCTVTSRRPGLKHAVWTRGHVANCSCELSALGGKPCPHGALALFWAAWQRAEVRR